MVRTAFSIRWGKVPFSQGRMRGEGRESSPGPAAAHGAPGWLLFQGLSNDTRSSAISQATSLETHSMSLRPASNVTTLLPCLCSLPGDQPPAERRWPLSPQAQRKLTGRPWSSVYPRPRQRQTERARCTVPHVWVDMMVLVHTAADFSR